MVFASLLLSWSIDINRSTAVTFRLPVSYSRPCDGFANFAALAARTVGRLFTLLVLCARVSLVSADNWWLPVDVVRLVSMVTSTSVGFFRCESSCVEECELSTLLAGDSKTT